MVFIGKTFIPLTARSYGSGGGEMNLPVLVITMALLAIATAGILILRKGHTSLSSYMLGGGVVLLIFGLLMKISEPDACKSTGNIDDKKCKQKRRNGPP